VVALKTIFKDSWDDFVKAHKVREVVDFEVRKVIDCGDSKKGFTVYDCDCGNLKIVSFRCKSRTCNSCGYQYQSFRADFVKRKLINCDHRHIVFTIAQELRIYFQRDRKLLNVLFQSAAQTISSWWLEQTPAEQFECGMISTLHTFGRDLKWNPHIHMLVTLGATGKNTPFKKSNFIPFAMLRKRFMTTLLFNLRNALADSPYFQDFKKLVSTLYKAKENGFYVFAYAKLTNSNEVINYMLRYIARPVIAQKRILKYQNGMVTFCYNRHEDEKYVEETIPVFEFLKKVIIHIPDRYFNMIRYYGLYAKPHNLTLKMKKLPLRHLRKLNLWQIRIQKDFGINPLKCTCGKFMSFFEIVFPNSS